MTSKAKETCAVWILAFLFYVATASRSLGFGDTAIFFAQILNFELATDANTHNLLIVLGQLFQKIPFIDNPFFKNNLISVTTGATCMSLFFALLRRLHVQGILALLCSCIFMVSHSMWFNSTLVESYTINIIFLLGILHATLSYDIHKNPRYLYLATFLAGFSSFNHMQNGLLIVAVATLTIGLYLKKKVSLHQSCLAALWGVIGFTPLLSIILIEILGPLSINEVWNHMSGGSFQNEMFHYKHTSISNFLHLLFLQFPSPFLALIAIPLGIKSLLKSQRSTLCIATIVLLGNTVFFIGYPTWDQFCFLLPTFCLLALSASLSAQQISNPLILLILLFSISIPPLLYQRIPQWAQSETSYWKQRYPNTPPHTLNYITNPSKFLDHHQFKYIEEMFQNLPQNTTLLLSDGGYYYQTKLYQEYFHKRDDIQIKLINSWGYTNWGISLESYIQTIDFTTQAIYWGLLPYQAKQTLQQYAIHHQLNVSELLLLEGPNLFTLTI